MTPARRLSPILNVSDLPASFAWFAKLGWAKAWDWSAYADARPTFGAVASGDLEIFLCLDCQGGRGKDGGVGGHGQGVWMSIWVDDVDEVHAVCQREGLEVLQQPLDEDWGVREMHVRHPDGHVFRISQPIHAHDHDHPHDHSHTHEHGHSDAHANH
jgi:catechol 2,3-dioxygenase-like lactoylglutathione lyase family enzyme